MKKKQEFYIFSINPGSTSTKVALFKNDQCIAIENIFHDAKELKLFQTINEQLPLRMHDIYNFIEENKIDLNNIDAIVGRGGPSYSVKSGIYYINEKLIKDTKEAKGGLYHSSMLGVQMAYLLHQKYGGLCLMMNPTVVDEYQDLARVTGIKGIYRTAASHALNMKEISRRYALKVKKDYKDLRLITMHIDGGISATVHLYGKMVDGIDGGGGDGPFTPTRMGGMAITTFNNNLNNLSYADKLHLTTDSGGFVSYFNTSDIKEVMKLYAENNSEAKRVLNALVYQCAKTIGSLSIVLKGDIDAILITGGLCNYALIRNKLKKYISFLAPVIFYPGEYEHEAMSRGAYEVLSGKTKAKYYNGKPVFNGFKEDAHD